MRRREGKKEKEEKKDRRPGPLRASRTQRGSSATALCRNTHHLEKIVGIIVIHGHNLAVHKVVENKVHEHAHGLEAPAHCRDGGPGVEAEKGDQGAATPTKPPPKIPPKPPLTWALLLAVLQQERPRAKLDDEVLLVKHLHPPHGQSTQLVKVIVEAPQGPFRILVTEGG